MSTPNFSRNYEWDRLVRTRLEALRFCQQASAALGQNISSNAVISIAHKLGEFAAAAARVGAFTDAQYAAVAELAKADTGDADYDLAANATALHQAARGIIALCRATLPTDADGFVTVLKINEAGSQTVTPLTPLRTADLKAGLDQLVTALGG